MIRFIAFLLMICSANVLAAGTDLSGIASDDPTVLGEGADGKLNVMPGGKIGGHQARHHFSTSDFRFTVGKDGELYAWYMTVPKGGETLRIASMGRNAKRLDGAINQVELFGWTGRVKWTQEDDALIIECPSKMDFKTAIGFRIGSAPCKTVDQSPTEKDLAAYLLVYFKDSDHSLHMALSADGYAFTDINEGKPVIEGETIALQKGIRDPHIMRGPDNMFYMSMTDLHISARRAGFRKDEWERDAKKYGWGNNRSLVLMKSADLIHWTHANVEIDKLFPEFKELGCAWAPQTVWDEEKNLPMVYFSIRIENEPTRLYYAYADAGYTTLVTAPKRLFKYPGDLMCIDADITKVGDRFHMFYVAHDGTPGIKQAVSDKINEGYVYDPAWVDSEEVKCEAPNVWKRIGEDKWVLMYDIYGLRPPTFGFRETSDFKTFTDLGRFNEGKMKATNFESPKHGTIIPLTQQEAEELSNHWNYKLR